MKKFWITLLSILTLALSIVGIVACGGSGDVLANYLLKEDGTLVEKDFVLPYTVGGEEVTWTSDKDAITVEKRTEDWLAKVTLGDEATAVKLTVKCGSESKDFNVTVAALDVSYFVKNFKFKQDKATVYEDFDLPAESTINGKTATIVWSVDDKDKSYIEISADGQKCEVTQSSLNPEVRIYAAFTYNDRTQKTNYRMNVSFKRDALEEVDYWYCNTGVSIPMSGYVVAVAEPYSSYGNCSFYMVNDEGTAGYYIYRIKTDEATGTAIVPGVHVTVTNTTNTSYNGLMETNSGTGTVVVDTDKEKIDVNTTVYAIDNDILAKSPAALYHTSALVSLDKWTVKSVGSAPAAGATATLFTLTKGGIDVKVAVSKYMAGVYETKAENAIWKGICDKQAEIQANAVVSIKGVLGYNNGYQIMPLSADDITVETEAATEASEAVTNAAKAIKAVQDAFKGQGVSGAGATGYIIVADKQITVPTAESGVEISYKVLRNSPTVSYDGNGTLNVTAGNEDIATIQITYTVKGAEEEVLYTTTTFHSIHSVKMDDAAVVDDIKFYFEFTVTEAAEDIDLPATVSQYPGATISWAVVGENVEGATISGNKFVVNPSTERDLEVKIVGTIEYGTASIQTEEYTITVPKADPNKMVLTSKELNLPEKYTSSGTGSANGINFSWVGMADFGDGIQMRTNSTTGTSSFWNTDAVNPITKLVLVWSDTKTITSDKSNQLKIEFANNAEFTDAQEVFATFTTDKTVEITVPDGSYTYIRITHNNQGAVYLKSVQITTAEAAE